MKSINKVGYTSTKSIKIKCKSLEKNMIKISRNKIEEE